MRERRRVKLTDVAARAGVSVTTASYILNRRAGEMRISEETVARVDEAGARRLGMLVGRMHNARPMPATVRWSTGWRATCVPPRRPPSG